jgi:hypothetical protein
MVATDHDSVRGSTLRFGRQRSEVGNPRINSLRSFVNLREMLAAHKNLDRKVTELERKYDKRMKKKHLARRACILFFQTSDL